MFQVLLAMSLGIPASAQAMEIRVCGDEIRTYPLNEDRDLHSVTLQSFAVVNNEEKSRLVSSLSIELIDNSIVRDSRWLAAADIAKAGASAAAIAGYVQVIPSQFCNGALLKGAKLAKSETLAPGEALVFMHQTIAWSGKRDTLHISTGDGADAFLKIKTTPAQTKALWPIAGLSFAGSGPSYHSHHRWVALQQFAYDIALLNNGRTHHGSGEKMSDYFAYGAAVRSIADGVVVKATDGRPDSINQIQRPGEADDAYLQRVGEVQFALMAEGFDAVLGNHVVIAHPNGEHSVYAHLKPGSVKAKPGEAIKAGQVFAAVGSSGNSTEPHLHFQMNDCGDIAACRSIPIRFDGIRLAVEGGSRMVQSGDIVETLK